MTALRPHLRRAALPLLLTLPLALAACGSDAGSGSSGSASGSAASSAAGSSSARAGATPSSSAASSSAPSPSAAAGTPGKAECPPETGTPERHTSFDAAPPSCLKPGVDYAAKITTDAGAFTVDLLEAKAPATVNNFVFLARNKYYDGITFHRVIPGFMIQGGDPQGTGRGGPGYKFADELPAQGEYEIGSLAMANSGPNTNGSQFFVVTGPNGVSLPPQYSLFGKVTEGIDAVKKIEADGSQAGTPKTVHSIRSVEIVQK